jgi:alpha-glucosidase
MCWLLVAALATLACMTPADKSRLAAYLKPQLSFLLLVIGLGNAAAFEAPPAGRTYRLASPDQRVEASIRLPTPGTAERPVWSARFHRIPLFTGCGLGLQTTDSGELLAGARLIREVHDSHNQRVPVLFGKTAETTDRFEAVRFELATASGGHVDVEFRCYNDAVAFRYVIKDGFKTAQVTISNETTSFGVSGNPTAYAQYLENFNTSHEHNVTVRPAAELPPGQLLDMPLTLSWTNDTCAAITEASLRHYAGMSLSAQGTQSNQVQLVCQLTPRPDGNKVVGPLPLQTPWRVVLLTSSPAELLESSTLYCLNEPSVIKDPSWIKPGKITFPWWNGDVYNGQREEPILSVAMAKKYIDFCARVGIPTHSLTSDEKTVSPWYFQSAVGVAPGPDTDVTRLRPDFDLPTIRQYAKEKNIKLWTWVHQGALRGRVEQAFNAFEQFGWSGMMVDFFDHDDQDSVEHAEAILQAAARHHLLIHFHGIWKPTGWQRTYPNLMNHEGALNLEYLKWSDRCTPEHDVMMAFTRLIAGPMDYHLGGFRAVTRENFQPHNIAPNVLGTRCHQLGLYVCYDNPNPMIADYPTAYEGQPGFDFLLQVPTWWDQTRVVVARIGQCMVHARRKGKAWYLGGIAANQVAEFNLPLRFLGSGSYKARVWKDAPDSDTNPNDLVSETVTARSTDSWKVHFARDGGFVAQLVPENPGK